MLLKLSLLLWSAPLTEKIEEIYRAFIKESSIQFSELEEQVLQFHLSNLEYACGSNLHQVGWRPCAGLGVLVWECVRFWNLRTELGLLWINRKQWFCCVKV